jgi:uncharacterized protein (TIGR03435 family)
MKLWIFLLAGAAMAQTFDVASVKQGGPVRPDGLLEIDLGHTIHGDVTLANTTLSECIQYAYGLTNEEQIAGPDWIRGRAIRFSIEAKAPPDTPIGQIRLMLQALLKERFQLELHHERRKIQHFELTVAKGGPRLTESKPDEPPVRVDYGIGKLAYHHLTMDRFVLLLSRQMKQPVFDKTGLTAAYNIALQWTPDDVTVEDAVRRPDIFTALREQLGLRLEAAKDPLDVLVVDKAEKVPAAN